MVLRKVLLSLCALSWLTSLEGWFWFKKDPEPEQIEKPKVQPRIFTLMIHPADSHTPRAIEDIFERTITLECAQDIKRMLENRIPGVYVVLTRSTAEVVEPLQCASFANKLNVDFYISLHFYQSSVKVPKLYLYHMLYNPVIDFWQTRESELSLMPYDKAYRNNIKKTQAWGSRMLESLKGFSGLSCQGLFGIPFRPLKGVLAPALGIECSVKKKEDYRLFVEPLVTALHVIIKQFEPERKDDTLTQTFPLPSHIN